MKARFALDLTNDAVALLERGADGWLRLGEARFDDPALEGRLADLRALAEARAPDGFVSKLIIPDAQILYFECQVTGPDQATRRAEIRATLDGRTPYRIDELAFDFSRAGERARVAVVAKITLEEAEAFAFAYGFRPVAHVAVPEADRFAGEPFFGLTASAEAQLPQGVRYDRDQDPVRLLDLPRAEPAEIVPVAAGPEAAMDEPAPDLSPAEPPLATGGEPLAEVDEAPFVAVDDLDELGFDAAAAGWSGKVDPGDAKDNTEPTATPNPGAPADIVAQAQDDPQPPRAKAAKAGEEDANAQDAPADLRGLFSALAALPPDAAIAAEPQDSPEPTEEPVDLAISGGDGADASVAPEPPQEPGEGEPAPSADEDAPAPDMSDDREAESLLPLQQEAAPDEADAARDTLDGPGACPQDPGTDAEETSADIAAPDAPLEEEAPAPAFQSRRAPEAGSGEDDAPGARLATILPRLGRGRAPAPKGPDLAGAHAQAGPTLTLRAAAKETAGLPGATGPLLGDRRIGRLSVPALPAFQLSPRLIAPLAGTLVAVAFVAWILLLTWGTDDPEGAGSPPETAAAPVAPQQPQTVRTVDLPEPQVRTEPPLSAPPAAMDQSAAPAIAADDGNRAGNGADGRPDVAILTSDRPLAGQPLPPAFGSILRYGADGRIVATPEGVVTPGGFLLVAGRPPRVPPAKPEGIAPPPAVAEPTGTEAEAQPFADPALQGKRPRPKPEGMIFPVTTPPAPTDETALPGAPPVAAAAVLGPIAPPVDPRHTARKPKARPATIVAAADAARTEAAATDAALKAASTLAVATSRRPPPRSAVAVAAAAAAALAVTQPELSIDNGAVEAALAEAQAAETPAEEPPPEADVPNELDEPEPADGIANIPTTRTVAKKSTFANAIDLGEVQLIGVYGSSSNRRALVRMPSGGMKKVQLGDRLDGGRVVAIAADELVYEKKGRTIRLTIMGRG